MVQSERYKLWERADKKLCNGFSLLNLIHLGYQKTHKVVKNLRWEKRETTAILWRSWHFFSSVDRVELKKLLGWENVMSKMKCIISY